MSGSMLLRWYYLATPIFLVIDVLLQAPLRVAFVGASGWRWLYYAFCMAIGILMRARPSATAALGMLESSVNVFLLIASVMLPIWGAVDTIDAGGNLPQLGLSGWRLVNFVLAAAALTLSFQRNQRMLHG